MSILSDSEIRRAMADRRIVVWPFRDEQIGPNSIDVHLGPKLGVYPPGEIDPRQELTLSPFPIPEQGFLLQPDELYLGVTLERTETRALVPWLDGRSSVGRLGLSIHATAGRGDVGFCGHWTLEMTVKRAVRVYAGMPIGQISYFTVEGSVERPYDVRSASRYVDQGEDPVPSRIRRGGW